MQTCTSSCAGHGSGQLTKLHEPIGKAAGRATLGASAIAVGGDIRLHPAPAIGEPCKRGAFRVTGGWHGSSRVKFLPRFLPNRHAAANSRKPRAAEAARAANSRKAWGGMAGVTVGFSCPTVISDSISLTSAAPRQRRSNAHRPPPRTDAVFSASAITVLRRSAIMRVCRLSRGDRGGQRQRYDSDAEVVCSDD